MDVPWHAALACNGRGLSAARERCSLPMISHTAQAGLVPPGYDMLFAVNGEGVPSVARFVRVT